MPFNIMGLMRNTLLNNIKIQYLNCFTSSQKTAKSRYRNISALFYSNLISSANKNGCKTINLALYSTLSTSMSPKSSPFSADKKRIEFGCFVRLGVHQFKPFAAIRPHPYFLLWGHREQDAPDKNNNR